MSRDTILTPPTGAVRSATKIAVVYFIFGMLWILTSDWILRLIVRDAELWNYAQTAKGWFYVTITAILVYVLVRNDAARMQSYIVRLRDSENRYRRIIETAGDVIVCLDAEHRIGEWNGAAVNVLGWTREEALGRDYLELVVPPEQRATLSAALRRVAAGEPTREVEGPAQTKSGELRTLLWNADVLPDTAGGAPEVLAIGHDITARKNLESQLRQAQKMEALGLLAGGVAHDINNVLTAIFAHVEFIDQQLEKPPLSTDRMRADTRQIEAAAQRAAILTRQLLAFGRRQVLSLEVLALNDVLVNVERMLRRLIWESIDLRINLAPEPWRIRADAGQLEQVIMNLVINARDAMRAGGVVTLETSNLTLDEDYVARRPDARVGPHVCLTVSDTGCGMNEATLQRIFEPFFTTKPVGEGTGLGLSTVHGIVKQLGGHITVYSEVRRGTTFRVYFPADPESRGSISAPSVASEPARGTETVLVCEDDEIVRALILRTLETSGYRVLAAEDPNGALRLANGHDGPIELLLTDVVMPHMNGPDLAREVRGVRPRIRVMYVSGYTANVIEHHGALGEGVAFLEKPFSTRRLLQCVREILDATGA